MTHRLKGQRSAMRPLARLLLPPWLQDDVAPVGGVLLREKRDVEHSEQRRRPDGGTRGSSGVSSSVSRSTT
ncbi:hypothetical protein EYF80_026336 [Liparis tanakae]|uniref:Uncharacterized protein n=1 Tax=Liparis tanakae TaxID=230148 RepID=A0A4Z2HCK9_9TELE|nr:hypothetical protein EYF80_026336 [Liparis tanakae]